MSLTSTTLADKIWTVVSRHVLCLVLYQHAASAAIINLTNVDVIEGDGDIIAQSTMTSADGSVHAGYLHDAIFRRPTDDDETGSGSGVFRDLYTSTGGSSQGTNNKPADKQQGYNRHGIMDSHIASGFDPFLTVGQLVLDSSGSYYVFVMDTNEPGGGNGKFISLDDLTIYVGGNEDPANLPQSEAEMEAELGLPVYDMNPNGEQNHVLLDYSLHSGSGEMDMFVFIPKSAFDGLAADSLVYVYTEFGGYTEAPGFDAAAGAEQVSIPGKSISVPVEPVAPPPTAVPEPTTWMMMAIFLTFGCLSRNRQLGS